MLHAAADYVVLAPVATAIAVANVRLGATADSLRHKQPFERFRNNECAQAGTFNRIVGGVTSSGRAVARQSLSMQARLACLSAFCRTVQPSHATVAAC